MTTSAGEMEFEAAQYSNPYSNPEMEEEWEMHEGSQYSSPYSNPYTNPEWEYEADRFFPLVAKAATKLLPHAVRIGRNLISGGRRRPTPRRSASRPRQMGSRNQQISALFHQLGRAFAQGESEAATQEAHLFGANEFETEVAANEVAHQAALTEVMAAEASHTESESEAQALLLRVMPSVQRRTVSTLGAMQRSGQPVTPVIAANVMKGQAARVLTTPHICRQALTRNMIVRQQTVAPGGPVARPGMRPGMRVPARPGIRPGRTVSGPRRHVRA